MTEAASERPAEKLASALLAVGLDAANFAPATAGLIVIAIAAEVLGAAVTAVEGLVAHDHSMSEKPLAFACCSAASRQENGPTLPSSG